MSSTQQLLLGEGAVNAIPIYIEEVFNTWLYTGNDTTQVITNGIDLATKGGLVWAKGRSGTTNHILVDTARGTSSGLITNTTDAAGSSSGFTSFDTTGFTFGGGAGARNNNGTTYCAWTFREQPKFFDVVTYTGNGSAGRTLSHSLGSQPGFILIKRTDGVDPWLAFARLNGTDYSSLRLNTTAAGSSYTQSDIASSTVINVGYINSNIYSCNVSSETYVVYIFAHDAGGFGLTGTDNVISCGSYTGNGSATGPVVTLGYEPQWVMIKNTINTSGSSNWNMYDNMRGMAATSSGGGSDRELYANSNVQEFSATTIKPLATGFQLTNAGGGTNYSGDTYIYMAIRRGPMKVPTSGTSVYNAVSRTGTGTDATITGIGFAPDLLDNQRTTAGSYTGFFDRLRGGGQLLYRALDDPDTTVTGQTTQFNTTMDGFAVGTSTATDSGNNNTVPYIWHCYKRAPSVFDIVCYTGNGSTQNVSHNLGVAPELMIVKGRNATGYDWQTYALPLGNTSRLLLNSNEALANGQPTWNSTTPTTTQFSLGGNTVNNSGATFVAYLFATCAGVSKVGSYTGTGALQTVNCGFAAGSRFILIKRTDSTGDWYVYDSTRGITSGNDPYLLWNTTGAEVTGTDYINTASVGFQVTAAAPAGLNATGGNYIFLAIA